MHQNNYSQQNSPPLVEPLGQTACWTQYLTTNYCMFLVFNSNYILVTKLPWPDESEGTLRSSEPSYHLPTCLPHTVEAPDCSF